MEDEISHNSAQHTENTDNKHTKQAQKLQNTNKTNNTHNILPQHTHQTTKTQIPIRVPAGIPPALAAAVVQQLRSDPNAALQAFEQAQRVLATPGLAQAYLGMGMGGVGAMAAAAAVTGKLADVRTLA